MRRRENFKMQLGMEAINCNYATDSCANCNKFSKYLLQKKNVLVTDIRDDSNVGKAYRITPEKLKSK